MKIEYLRTARHSYMIVREADFMFEHYEVQMILHNDISSLLRMKIIVGDGRVEYWYDVTGMQSLEKQFAVSALDERKLRFLLQSLCDMKQQMEDYMLDDRNIDFSASMVFYDRNAEKIRFCYIPGYLQTKPAGIRGLLEEIIQHLDHKDSRAVRIGYEMYECCVQSDFLISDCQRCLSACQDENLSGGIELVDDISVGDFAENMEEKPEEKEPESRRKWIIGRKKKREKKHYVPDYREILEEEQSHNYVAEDIHGWNQTVCFSQTRMKKVWELSYQGDGMEGSIKIGKLPFVIGKDENRVDGVIHAQTVSRVHARITGDEECLYLEDYNSTNGTYLNGKLIPMNTPMVLHRGDHIIFATEEYILIDRHVPKC